MNNPDNITWVEGENFCRWKGMHHDEYQKLLGTDADLRIDTENVMVVGDTVYCESANDFLQFLHTFPDAESLHEFIHDTMKVRTFGQMRYDINLELLREFESDLNAHYKVVTKES